MPATRPLDHSTTRPLPFVVGLGGQAGSGKTEFARALRRLGAQVIDADRIGWSLLKRTAPTYPRLVRVFGRRILDAQGNIDRQKLGRVVFADRKALTRLNRIVHPALLAELRRRVRAQVHKAQGTSPRLHASRPTSHVPRPILVVDAALLFYWNWQRVVDLAVMVSSRRELKLARLTRSGLSRTEACRRLRSQLPESDMCRRADVVVTNNGTLVHLRRKARALWRLLTKRA